MKQRGRELASLKITVQSTPNSLLGASAFMFLLLTLKALTFSRLPRLIWMMYRKCLSCTLEIASPLLRH